MAISDDCASNIHEFCNPCDCKCHMKEQLTPNITKLTGEDRLFLINRTEALALYKLLQHEWIPKNDEYETLMRLLNGLSNFIADTEPSK